MVKMLITRTLVRRAVTLACRVVRTLNQQSVHRAGALLFFSAPAVRLTTRIGLGTTSGRPFCSATQLRAAVGVREGQAPARLTPELSARVPPHRRWQRSLH